MLLQKELYYELSDLNNVGTKEDRQITFEEYDTENPYHYKAMDYFETGALTYGNADPQDIFFNSLADFYVGEGCIEIRIPWQLFNFADPTEMYIHDDYYINYGVEYIKIDTIMVGIGSGSDTIAMNKFELKPLGKKIEYHERLKESYNILQKYWNKEKKEGNI